MHDKALSIAKKSVNAKHHSPFRQIIPIRLSLCFRMLINFPTELASSNPYRPTEPSSRCNGHLPIWTSKTKLENKQLRLSYVLYHKPYVHSFSNRCSKPPRLAVNFRLPCRQSIQTPDVYCGRTSNYQKCRRSPSQAYFDLGDLDQPEEREKCEHDCCDRPSNQTVNEIWKIAWSYLREIHVSDHTWQIPGFQVHQCRDQLDGKVSSRKRRLRFRGDAEEVWPTEIVYGESFAWQQSEQFPRNLTKLRIDFRGNPRLLQSSQNVTRTEG